MGNECITQAKWVPAHRVVNRNGILTGKHHFETADRMQELLEEEGVNIKEDQIVNFNELFWDPIKRIGVPVSFFFNFSTKITFMKFGTKAIHAGIEPDHGHRRNNDTDISNLYLYPGWCR